MAFVQNFNTPPRTVGQAGNPIDVSPDENFKRSNRYGTSVNVEDVWITARRDILCCRVGSYIWEKKKNNTTRNQISIAQLKGVLCDEAEFLVIALLFTIISNKKWLSDCPTAFSGQQQNDCQSLQRGSCLRERHR